jgi:hypothetical protein
VQSPLASKAGFQGIGMNARKWLRLFVNLTDSSP